MDIVVSSVDVASVDPIIFKVAMRGLLMYRV